jgi:hypothetical protein
MIDYIDITTFITEKRFDKFVERQVYVMTQSLALNDRIMFCV